MGKVEVLIQLTIDSMKIPILLHRNSPTEKIQSGCKLKKIFGKISKHNYHN